MAMQELRDGRFGSIELADDMIRRLAEMSVVPDTLKAIHFGTPDELIALRAQKAAEKSFEERLSALERKMTPGAIQIVQPDELKPMGFLDMVLRKDMA